MRCKSSIINTYLRCHYFLTIRIEEAEAARRLQKEYRDLLCEWKGIRGATINMIRNTAENLVRHHQNVNISRITGSAAGITGSGIAILGFALAPVTFGASLGLTIGGVAIAAAGGATAAGAGIVDVIITKYGVENTQKQLKDDQDMMENIKEIQIKIEKQNKRIKDKCPDLKDVDIFQVTDVFAFAHGIAKAGNLAFKIGEAAGIGAAEFGILGLRAAGVVARGVAAAGVVLNLAIIPIDIIEIVRSGWNIAHGNETKASKQLREKADELEKQKNEICDQMNL